MKQFTSRKAFLLCATVLAGISASPALAQTTPPASGSAATAAVDEIVITATHRSSAIQNAPINISAVTAQTIQAQRIDDVKSLAAFTPGVKAASDLTSSMR